MPVPSPKKRIINFRLTEEEYEHLQRALQVQQARSVSDYVRAVLLQTIKPETGSYQLPQVVDRITELESRVSGLAAELQALRS